MLGAKLLGAYVTNEVLVAVGMTVGRNGSLRYEHLITGGTRYACGVTVLGTGSLLSVKRLLGVAECGNSLGIGVISIMLTGEGLSSLLLTGRSEGDGAVIPSVCRRVELTVFSAANGTNRLLGTGSSAANALVIAADGTNAVYVIMLGALLKHRNNNVLYAYLNKLIAFLNVKHVASVAGVELYVTGSIESGSNGRVLLSLASMVVVVLIYCKRGRREYLNLSTGLFYSKNDYDTLTCVFCNSVT